MTWTADPAKREARDEHGYRKTWSRKRLTEAQRIEKFFDQLRQNGECVEWTGSKNRAGYGRVAIEDGQMALAHRLMWMIKNGPIPDGSCILHKCDNPACVNPDHLFVGSHEDNMRDMRIKGRSRRKLSIGDVERIADARRSGASIVDLAAVYDVATSSISKAVRAARRL